MNTQSHDRHKHPTITGFVFLGVFTLLVSTLVSRGRADDLDPWLKSENGVATTRLFNNLLPNGAVIASPANRVFNDPCHPDYYYHWVRDGSLAMDVLVSLYANSPDQSIRDRSLKQLMSYIDFSLNLQQTNNLSSVFGRGLGEPKFITDGSPIQCGWGRPQNDGPALRAASLCRLANRLLDSGQPDLVTLVKTKLYDSVLPTNSLIKRDLEYVSHFWGDSCIDLWEESGGHHFYTRMVQRRALRDGAVLARRLTDGGAADFYSAQAAALENAIQGHWDPGRGLLIGTLDMEGPRDNNNNNYKTSGLDVAVALGVLHANTPGDDFFSPTDDKVLATAQKLTASFGFYKINRTTQDDQGEVLGTAIGRYPEDRYFGGNPWFLCTAAMGELYFRAANLWESKGSLTVSDSSKAFFSSLASSRFSSLQSGQTLSRSDPAFDDVLSTLRAAGDAQLRRVKYHAASDGSLSEQYFRDNGYSMSFGDLSWSYASILTATAWRAPSGVAPGDVRPFRPARPVDHGAVPGEPFIPDFAKPLNRLGLPLDEVNKRFPRVMQSTPRDVDQAARNTRPSGRFDYRSGGTPADDIRGTTTRPRQPTLDDLNRRLLRLEQSVDKLSREIQADRSSN
ncbi:MAG: glycoside hydrolase family 15 protein [Isosphaeraceae bacterium]|jgi:glucoamylase